MRSLYPLIGTVLIALAAAALVAAPIRWPHASLGAAGLQIIVAVAATLLVLVLLNPPRRS